MNVTLIVVECGSTTVISAINVYGCETSGQWVVALFLAWYPLIMPSYHAHLSTHYWFICSLFPFGRR